MVFLFFFVQVMENHLKTDGFLFCFFDFEWFDKLLPVLGHHTVVKTFQTQKNQENHVFKGFSISWTKKNKEKHMFLNGFVLWKQTTLYKHVGFFIFLFWVFGWITKKNSISGLKVSI